jgi:hypothetical protein
VSHCASNSRGAFVLLVALAAACGHRTELPQETKGGSIPATNTYNVKQVWGGFAGASDVLLTSGSQVFVAFPDSNRVAGYYRSSPDPRPNGVVIPGEHPTFLAEIAGRELVIAEQDPTRGGRVRIVDLRSLVEVGVFADTSWVLIGGVAADDSSHIYVSDRDRNVVRKYTRSGELLLTVADAGSGAGYVDRPGGLDWRAGRLFVADTGKNWVQALDPEEPNTAEFFLTGSDNPLGPFQGVADVAGDEEDNVYIADLALGAVIKYSGEPAYDQRVDANAPEGTDGHLVLPIALSASATLVFVLDGDTGRIVTFELDR